MRPDAARASAPSARPRNALARALSGLRGRGMRRRDARAQEQRQHDLAQLDPDQRVRALGEW